jgi:N-acetylmuramoyl-L-alanine amidase
MLNRLRVTDFPRLFLLFLLFSLFAGQAIAQEDLRITDIRFWQSPEEAQIVIDLNEVPRIAPVNALPDGTYFFDVAMCSFRPGRQSYPLYNQFIKALTVQERDDKSVRVYFRIPAGIRQRTFFLPKNLYKPDRIVIFLSESVQMVQRRRENELNEVRKLKSKNIRIVVIDPGHGGEDPGARHNGIIEKDYVLRFAHLVKAYFDRDPRYHAILTRSADYIIPLDERSKMAERLGADAFVSVHVNYNRKKAIRGIEVYYESYKGAVGQAENLVAELENSQDEVGGVAQTHSEALPKGEILNKQAEIMYQSGVLAGKVNASMGNAVPGLPTRGVKRAGFKVLHSLSLPSVLLELGYTSNPEDVVHLKNPQSQQRLAQSIYQGVRDYLETNIETGKDFAYFSFIEQKEAEERARAAKKAAAEKRRKAKLAKSRSYTVKRGDTLGGVAKKFKVSQASIRDLNGFSSKTKLQTGKTIRIP